MLKDFPLHDGREINRDPAVLAASAVGRFMENPGNNAFVPVADALSWHVRARPFALGAVGRGRRDRVKGESLCDLFNAASGDILSENPLD